MKNVLSLFNETMIYNKDNKDNDNTIWNVFIGLFSVVILIGVICLCVIIFKCIKGKKLFKNKYTENAIYTCKNDY